MFDRNESPRYVLRGGSWNNPPKFLRSACRGRYFADSRDSLIGFRLVYREPLVDARRVLRGGAWFNNQVSVRAAFRFRGNPYDRVGFIGFRLIYRESPHD